MAALKFTQFLRRYDIRLFFSSVEDTIPGSLISKDKKGYFPVGHISDYLDNPNLDWTTEMKEASMVYGTVERELSLGGRASLNEFGVGIHGGLGKAKSVKFYIEEVRAMGFLKPMRLNLIADSHELKKSNKKTWKLINNKCVVDYTYYASKVTFDFEREGNFDLKAEIINKITASAETEIKWKSKSSFVVTNNTKVPFGFSGWEI